jgi:hypothetical protein
MSCRRLLALLAPALLLVAVAFAPAAPRPSSTESELVDQVRKAIDEGIRFLRQKEDDGNWDNAGGRPVQMGGASALAVLALLNAGVKPDGPVIQRGLRYLRSIPNQWTYVVALQTMAYAEAGQKEDRERIQRNADWLLANRIVDDGKLRGWAYPRGASADNSNTQYALLGLHAAKAAGVKIDRQVWESIRAFYMETQHAKGGWQYRVRNVNENASLTMTSAGFCGLLIAGMELNEGREKLLANGRAENCGVYKENEALGKALGWIGSNLRVSNYPGHTYYNIYGIERAGRLSGQRFLGRHDWYREGCRFLVGAQRDDGSWPASALHDSWPVVNTSFALLFLSKGRTPILISKMVHDPEDDWNNDRYDARNLVDYAVQHMFRKQPLAWQIYDAKRIELDTRPKLLDEVSTLLQSPIVYFNGHQAPIFQNNEEALLKEYVNQGGFILAEACCGDRRFDKGFRELMEKPEMFGPGALKRLDPDHPIWRAHAVVPPNNPFELYGIKQGCKTVVVYSPQDLSCLWEANKMDDPRGGLAFRLGGNIIAYATGMELPKPRLTRAEVFDDQQVLKSVPRGLLKVAQLHHEGDWQPAPRAVQKLMLYLRDKLRLEVVLKPEELSLGEKLPDRTPAVMNFKFLYMHGRKDFSLDEMELKNLGAGLRNGGILFADACCGKKEFDTAFRRMIEQLFAKEPSHPKLEPIPLANELFSKELNGEAITSVRCRRERADGNGPDTEFRDVAPYLEGIKLNNRWVVIYSKYDIGCALENHASPDCMGHDNASALKLGAAVVLYALKR